MTSYIVWPAMSLLLVLVAVWFDRKKPSSKTSPRIEIEIFLIVLRRRIHLKIADWMYKVMEPAITENHQWFYRALSELAVKDGLLESLLLDTHRQIDDLRVRVEELE